MPQIPYIFNQLTSYLPRDIFDRLVKKYNGNRYVKDYHCGNHLAVMIWAQLTGRESLRDIESTLRAHYDKLYRMGMGLHISRNNISNANAKRDVAIFRELALEMMSRTSRLSEKDPILSLIGEVFNLSGFFAIDSTTISLELNKFPWSVPQKEWGGLKVHTMYDLLRNTPRMCLITGHEERDQSFMEDYPYEPGCFYMFDKMYFKTVGLHKVHTSGAYFVTRIKKNVVYEITAFNPVDGNLVIEDKTIHFSSRWAAKGYPEDLRLIDFYSVEKNQVIEFLTNNFKMDAATITLLYKYRWQIELFFRWIKQHLRIKSFYGTSANAVMTQIYVAFISYCLLAIAAEDINFKGSIYELANIISVSLTEKIMLKDLIMRVNRMPQSGYSENLQKYLDF